MSITLNIGASATLVFTKARALVDGMVMQHIGTSFRDTCLLTVRGFRSKGGHSRTKSTVRVPYAVTTDQITETGEIFLTIETSAPANAPLSVIQQLPYLASSLAASSEFSDLVNSQAVTFQ